MADEADQADDIQQSILSARIKSAAVASKSLDTSNPSGVCWSCGAETGSDIWDREN